MQCKIYSKTADYLFVECLGTAPIEYATVEAAEIRAAVLAEQFNREKMCDSTDWQPAILKN